MHATAAEEPRPRGDAEWPKFGLADARRVRQHGLEHRLQIDQANADDLEHVGGGGLLLQRFAQLVEQARILDGDNGLRGEVLHQLDLLVGEWPHLLAVDDDRADQLVVLEHRHAQQCRDQPPSSTASDGQFDVSLRSLRSAMWTICFVSSD